MSKLASTRREGSEGEADSLRGRKPNKGLLDHDQS